MSFGVSKVYKYGALLIFFLLQTAVFMSWRYIGKEESMLVMGGSYGKQPEEIGRAWNLDPGKAKGEEYIRPSRMPIINKGYFSSDIFWKYNDVDPSEIITPENLAKTPENTVINYFTILRDAENLTSNKSGGCGTVGNSKLPFPLAYSMLSKDYKDKTSYRQYMKSFEGIGHTSLIKLKQIPGEAWHPHDLRYFVEIETIEGSDKDVTYFAYYYGYVSVVKEGAGYRISKLQFWGEDFLCAPMHGWAHNAEANVSIRYGNWCGLISEQYPTRQKGYVKDIYFRGTDGEDYYIEFFQLTNDTDIEISQYKKDEDGKWVQIHLYPEKCLEKKSTK